MRFILFACLLACLWACAGCAAFTDYAEAPSRGSTWSAEDVVWRNNLPVSPLHMEVSASRSHLAWGDTVIITARLVNDLAQPVSVMFGNGCTGGHSLWLGDELVYRPERACTMATVTRTYPPGSGDPFTIAWVWNQERIRPGAYRFVVGLGSTGEMDSGEVPIVLQYR